jgi:hypothetical protein
MKKTLLSLAVVAGFAVNAQNETNAMQSKNDLVSGGYIFNFADLTLGDKPDDINCVDQVLNDQGAAVSSEIVFVEGNDSTDRAITVAYKGNDEKKQNAYLQFTTGNCASLLGEPLDITNDLADSKLRIKVKADKDFGALIVVPVTYDSITEMPVVWDWYDYEDDKGGRWADPTELVKDEFKVIEWKMSNFFLSDSTKFDGSGLIGVRIAHSEWTPTGTLYEDVTFTIDWLSIGTEEVFAMSSEKLDFVAEGFNVYPNPASDVLNIKFDANSETSVNLVDLTGKIVASQNAQAGAVTTEFQLSDLNAGIYFVNVQSSNGSATQKVVIK